MKFSTSSWHYKFNKFMTDKYDTEAKTGLCQYFWFTVWNIIKALGVALVLTAGVALVCYFGFLVVTFFLGVFGIFYMGQIWELSVVGLFVSSLVGLVIGTIECIEGDMKFAPEYMTKWFKKADTMLVNKPPSLIKEYYKATKTKICPVIEWED